jgi:hypothetical protein
VLYVYVAQRLLASGRRSALLVSLAGLAVWGVVAVAAAALLASLPT